MWVFSSLFDVLLECSSSVVIYTTYVTLGRKVFEIRFQLQTSVCFLSISWKREKGKAIACTEKEGGKICIRQKKGQCACTESRDCVENVLPFLMFFEKF